MGTAQVANVDVFLVLSDAGGRLLLALRARHLWAGGFWNVPSGKAEPGEDVISAVRREAAEEIGIRLGDTDIRPAGVVHYGNRQDTPRVGFAFAAQYAPGRHGAVVNAEPDKCDAIGWYPPGELPQPLDPYNAAILAAAASPARFTIAGW